MAPKNIVCQSNPFTLPPGAPILGFADRPTARRAAAYHQSLPGYAPTPLVRLNHLAARLGVNEILVKDESHRLGLNAFKVLGASYAIAKVLADKLGLSSQTLTYTTILQHREVFKDLTFVTATDGNHGKAVAWTASQLGCRAVVLLPINASPVRLAAIREFATEAWITEVNYDDTVRLAEKMSKENRWVLLQDTSWPGYEQIPSAIMQGYFTLITEYMDQSNGIWPTHVFLQAGVGSLAAAVLSAFHCFAEKALPRFIVVEPDGAPCFYKSSRQPGGEPYVVKGDLETIMAGLACGEPSLLAWKILKAGSTAFIRCSDAVARRGMKVLGNPLKGDRPVISGESGAVTLGLVYELLSNDQYKEIRAQLELDRKARVLLLSTEGDTDPDTYRQIVWS